ncbi:YciI family protein [Caulobacter sp.]|uniref:YciI family protein n=1 Tax=Caulobacter sp. TaxID=78 RepID=UPI003BB1E224
MKYLLLIYSQEAAWALPENHAVLPDIVARHEALQDQLRADGKTWLAARLANTPAARTVVTQAEGQVAHDGPFAETKEQLAGFYLVEAPDMAAAEAWARKIPQIAGGKVEVREIIHSPS